MAIGTMWWRLLPWERWMWWRLSIGSDPATKPRARAATHRARWVSSARGLADGETCVLQHPNIFPELLFPDRGEGRGEKRGNEGGASVAGALQSPMALTSPDFAGLVGICTDPQEKKTKRGGKKKGKIEALEEKKNKALLEYRRKQPAVFSKSAEAAKSAEECHKS